MLDVFQPERARAVSGCRAIVRRLDWEVRLLLIVSWTTSGTRRSDLTLNDMGSACEVGSVFRRDGRYNALDPFGPVLGIDSKSKW